MSQGMWFLIIVVGMFAGVFVVAVVVKWWEVRRAAKWPSAAGAVVANGVQSQQNRPGEMAYNFGDTEVTNMPLVEYEFHVQGKKYTGRRITIGEKTSGYELESILARYPVGTAVTVFYNPDDPTLAVLERDLPGWIWPVAGGCLSAIIGVPLLAVFLYHQGLDWLRPHLTNPERAPFVAAAGGFGLLVFLFGLAFWAHVRRVSRWPTTPGKIVASGADAYQQRDERTGRLRTYHKANVRYRYEVNGREYQGDRLRLGVVVESTSPAGATRLATQYPVGMEVSVHYDPKQPGESVLHPRSAWHYLIWVIAAAMFSLAWVVGMG